MAEEEKKDEISEPSEFTPPPESDGEMPKLGKSLWSNHKRLWVMTMGMGGLVLISIVVWILTKP